MIDKKAKNEINEELLRAIEHLSLKTSLNGEPMNDFAEVKYMWGYIDGLKQAYVYINHLENEIGEENDERSSKKGLGQKG